jgi:hypothetical protein
VTYLLPLIHTLLQQNAVLMVVDEILYETSRCLLATLFLMNLVRVTPVVTTLVMQNNVAAGSNPGILV